VHSYTDCTFKIFFFVFFFIIIITIIIIIIIITIIVVVISIFSVFQIFPVRIVVRKSTYYTLKLQWNRPLYDRRHYFPDSNWWIHSTNLCLVIPVGSSNLKTFLNYCVKLIFLLVFGADLVALSCQSDMPSSICLLYTQYLFCWSW
jgi:hypothetical protein